MAAYINNPINKLQEAQKWASEKSSKKTNSQSYLYLSGVGAFTLVILVLFFYYFGSSAPIIPLTILGMMINPNNTIDAEYA